MNKSDLKICPVCKHGLDKDVWTEDYENLFHFNCAYCGKFQLFGWRMVAGFNLTEPERLAKQDAIPLLSIAIRQKFTSTGEEVFVDHNNIDAIQKELYLPKSKKEYIDILLNYLVNQSTGAFDDIKVPYSDYPLMFLKDEQEFEELLDITQNKGYIANLHKPHDGYYQCKITTSGEERINSLSNMNTIPKYIQDPGKKLTVLVSSTVYGIEELLERIYSLLSSIGYEVWMSHKGTVPVNSAFSNIENCLKAVEQCDLFLAIITNRYGTGKDEHKGKTITHLELEKAIELNKPRWILAHDHVVYTRLLLNKLGYTTKDLRQGLKLEDKNHIFEDMRIIDMYELATSHGIPYEEKKGDWVQTFSSTNDAVLFASAQFYRYQEVEEFIKEQLSDIKSMQQNLKNRGGK